jgi:hypothetical protein
MPYTPPTRPACPEPFALATDAPSAPPMRVRSLDALPFPLVRRAPAQALTDALDYAAARTAQQGAMTSADWQAAEPAISAAERARDDRRDALDQLRCPNSGWDGACYPGQCPTHNP